MKKKVLIPLVSIFGVILLVFNLVFWLAIKDVYPKTATVYLNYSFTMVAIFLAAFASLRVLGKNSKFLYKTPAILVTYSYLILEFILTPIFVAFTRDHWLISFIIQIIILGAVVVLLLLVKGGMTYVEHQDNKVKEKVFYIKSLKVDFDNLEFACEDAETKNIIHKVGENVRYSDPMSNDLLHPIEDNIMGEFANLKQFVNDKNYESAKESLNKIDILLKERNTKCAILK